MDAISSSFLVPFPHLNLFAPSPTPTPSRISLPTVANIRIEERHQAHVRTQSTITTAPPPLISEKPVNGKSAETVPQGRSIRQSYKVRPSPTTTTTPSLPVTLCNALDDLINNFIDRHPLRSSVNPQDVLANNFAPVTELPPTNCTVEGRLPSCLDGAYIRNGPNPQFLPRGGYHLFDGDGMLHTVRISDERATYCSRYVRTYKFTKEREAGSPLFPNFFAAFDGAAGIARAGVFAARVLTGQLNPLNGAGLANTSLAFVNNTLLALGESGFPYAVRLMPDGDVVTIGRWDFDGRLLMGMSAHPKVDPATGEIFSFRCGPIPPFLNYFRIGLDGTKQPDVPIFSFRQPSFVHDFAITERHAIFPDMQIVMKPMDMITGEGPPVGYDAGKVPRVGIIPRCATDESDMKWFEVPGFNFVHSVNAWDEKDGEEVVLIAANTMPAEHMLERMDRVHCTVEMVRINLREGRVVSRKPLSTKNLEWGVINPAFLGRKNHYSYMGIGDPMPKVSSIVKLDFDRAGKDDCVVASRSFGERCFAGEPFFVAKNDGGEEDDGYVVTYTHDEGSGESRFVVMDANSPALDIVASVKLPRRVPYGFHGLFVSAKDLQKQKI